jgi:hypothetical protein
VTTKFIPPNELPDYGFISQAMQCNRAGKYNNHCWGGCPNVLSLKNPDFTKGCPRKIKNEFDQLFHID